MERAATATGAAPAEHSDLSEDDIPF
jgi:hypothetical protein